MRDRSPLARIDSPYVTRYSSRDREKEAPAASSKREIFDARRTTHVPLESGTKSSFGELSSLGGSAATRFVRFFHARKSFRRAFRFALFVGIGIGESSGAAIRKLRILARFWFPMCVKCWIARTTLVMPSLSSSSRSSVSVFYPL